MRRLRIVAKEVGPQHEGHVGHSHRRARVTRFRFLDGVDRQKPDRVDAELFELVFVSDLRLVTRLCCFDCGAGFLCGAAHTASQ